MVPQPGPSHIPPSAPPKRVSPKDPASSSDDASDSDDASNPPAQYPSDNEASEDTSLNTQMKNDFKNVFKKLSILFPESFESETTNRPYCISANQSKPKLILDKEDDPSWFSPKDGSFPSKILPPRKSKPHPPDFKPNVFSTRPKLFSIRDSNFKEFLESNQLDKAELDSLVFVDSNTISIKHLPHCNVDSLLKDILYDFLIMDKLFNFVFDLVNLAKMEISDPNTSTPDFPTLDLIFEIMSLAARTSLRASQLLTAAFVANRTAIRDVVLDKFEGHETSKENLRGSPFDSKDLFGPIPDSLKDKLTAQYGQRFMLSLTKPSKSSLPSNKRRLNLPAPPPKKKALPLQSLQSSTPQWSSNKSSPQWSTTKPITPRSYENFQNFRKTKGKAKQYSTPQSYRR